ncbi:acyl-CoA carboxylase subunit epsilon [Agrococcus sp. DT81.2]|uniref:acyl-CoA carboxylase subunit epsilon n=1 Tax=Agrococcus sp. DT81.2 TaxID=3393414 RepID=UPI003CE545F7
MSDSSEPSDATEPIMTVVGGSPTAEERAAVEAVLLGMAGEWAETKHRRVLDTESEWQAKSRNPIGHRWKRD